MGQQTPSLAFEGNGTKIVIDPSCRDDGVALRELEELEHSLQRHLQALLQMEVGRKQ